MILYLTEPGLSLSVHEGHFLIKDSKQVIIKEVPIKLIHSIISYTYVYISGGATNEILQEGIPLLYISVHGKVLGKLLPIKEVNVERQRKQVGISEDDTACLYMTKKVIAAKIHNQTVYSRRLYRADRDMDIESKISALNLYEQRATTAESIDEAMGYEGMASRLYFRILSSYLPDEFKIEKRTKNPPTDPTNSLLSFAYTLLHSEIYTALEAEGLHPYFGFMHRIRRGHAALASDMIEEFRSVIADPFVVNFVNYSGISVTDFTHYDGNPGWFLSREKSREFLRDYEKKIQQKNQYTGEAITYRQAIASQAHRLAVCIDEEDLSKYEPIRMR